LLTALTRAVSASIGSCELSYIDRQPIDVALASAHHHEYQEALRRIGLEVIALPPLDHLPDAVFVEDTAVVVDEIAVLARPGAQSRVPEVAAIAPELRQWRQVVPLGAGTLDGGDVLRVGRRFFVGLGGRTNPAGAAALHTALAPFGYQVTPVSVTGCLHLKTAASSLGDDRVLVHRPWFEPAPLAGLELIDVPADEGWAANVLHIANEVIMPDGFPGTRELLERLGYRTHPVPLSELIKAEAGVTCGSIIFRK
jgi:dimethylargininase